jgi:hypothetical protein
MASEQTAVLPIKMLYIIKRVKALMEAILHHELHVMFPLSGRPQYLLNGTLAYHHF